jgi:hypothetical protein
MDQQDDGAGSRGLGMEARVKALEDDMHEIKGDLRRLALDVAEIKGRVLNLPTAVQLMFMQAGLIIAIFAGAFGLLKLVGHVG